MPRPATYHEACRADNNPRLCRHAPSVCVPPLPALARRFLLLHQRAEPVLELQAVPVPALVPKLPHSALPGEVSSLLIDRAPMLTVKLPTAPLDARGLEEAQQAADEGEEANALFIRQSAGATEPFPPNLCKAVRVLDDVRA